MRAFVPAPVLQVSFLRFPAPSRLGGVFAGAVCRRCLQGLLALLFAVVDCAVCLASNSIYLVK
jgi:hypothetical protein